MPWPVGQGQSSGKVTVRRGPRVLGVFQLDLRASAFCRLSPGPLSGRQCGPEADGEREPCYLAPLPTSWPFLPSPQLVLSSGPLSDALRPPSILKGSWWPCSDPLVKLSCCLGSECSSGHALPLGLGFPCLLFLKKYFYYCLFIWLCWVLVVACWVFSCSMWNLVPWPGIEPGPSAMEAQSLSHWPTREVTVLFFLSKGHFKHKSTDWHLPEFES